MILFFKFVLFLVKLAYVAQRSHFTSRFKSLKDRADKLALLSAALRTEAGEQQKKVHTLNKEIESIWDKLPEELEKAVSANNTSVIVDFTGESDEL